jgi:glutamate-1-semialdehyde aminotransferase
VVDPPKPGFLEGVRKLASEFEVVLIFDEVKTGFRFGLGGAQKHFGVTPDLSTFGKAMGNGYPVSAVVGRKEIMEKVTHAWIASTFNGNVMSVAAGLATIRELERTNAIARFWPLGEQLMKGLDRIAAEAGIVGRSVGFGPMPFFKFPKEEENIKRAFYIETLRRGVYFEPNHVWFLSASHTEADIERALDVSEAALKAAIKKTR